MMIKKSIVLLVCTLLLSTTVYASTPTVWAYDAAHAGYEASIRETVEKHIPSFLIDDFNLHGGQRVINNNLNAGPCG